jgi:Galactose oxidase, central domain
MTFEIFSSLQSHLIRWARHSIMIGGLCLLVACGGGGGGGSSGGTNGAATLTDPTVTFTRTDALTTVYPNNTISLLPHFSYGTGRITVKDLTTNAERSVTVTSDALFTDTPQHTSVYTLIVSYQDPNSIRPSLKDTPAQTISVTVTPWDGSYPSCSLTASNATPLTSSSIQLTSSCSAWANGTITARSVTSSLQTASITEGVPIVMQTPSTTGAFSYTQSVTYVDSRVNQTFTHIYPATTVTVTNDLTQVTAASSMSTARGDFTATRLSNNLILVAGGTTNGTTVVSTAELYDQNTNTWRNTGSMTSARRGHTATALTNGKVLVTGGSSGSAALNTAEIYDPSTGLWAATTTQMNFKRSGHTATLLTDGKVLLVGGIVSTETIGGIATDGSRITELFDGSTFTTMASQLPSAVQGHTATRLSNGSVLIAGRNNADTLAGAETTAIYDFAKILSSTAAWYSGPPMHHGRYNHATTQLSDGTVMVSGGFLSGTTTEIFTLNATGSITNGSTYGTWSDGASLVNTRAQHTITLLRSGAVMVIGGYSGTSTLTSIEVLNSPSAPSSRWATMPHTLAIGRAMHRSILLSNTGVDPTTGVSIDKVLVTGTYMDTGSPNTTQTAELVWSP